MNTKIFEEALGWAKKHGPELLTGLGVSGFVTGTVLAVKATPKAVKKISNEKVRLKKTKLTPIETVKCCWTCYIPTVITEVASGACIIGALTISGKRQAALAAAYTISEQALKNYREQVIETIGERKEEKIRDAIAEKKLDKVVVEEPEIIYTGKGDTLVMDLAFGNVFKSDIWKIKDAVAELNIRLIDEMFISLNEFRYELGLPAVTNGDKMGWNIDNGKIDIWYSSQLKDGTPCLTIDYYVNPRRDMY